MNIIISILSVILMSFCSSNYKKAVGLGVNLSTPLFKLFADVGGIFIVGVLIYIFGIDNNILNDKIYLFSIFGILILNILKTYSNMYVLKNTKMSELFPYDNFDKLIIIILGFFLFSGTQNETSILTVIISILTIFVVVGFSLDLKKIKISKFILIHLFNRSFNGLIILLIGYILLKYSSLTYLSATLFFELITYSIIAIILGQSFKIMLQQSTGFYKSRTIGFLTGWSGTILGLYIIQSSGVIIASLLGFMSIIFNIITMKIVLNDSPSKKQILLSIIVMIMIGLGLLFNLK